MFDITIPDKEGRFHMFTLKMLNNLVTERIEVKDVCIIDITKFHNHRYDLRAFFYNKKRITYREHIVSKKELFCAIQKLLEENLSDV